MDSICAKKDCTACQACLNVCPVQAISMCEDECGFVYPLIHSELCIDCESCKRVCPSLSDTLPFNNPIEAYAGWTKDSENRHFSTSGGIAFALSKYIIEQGGVFCGCRWNVDHAEHAIVENANELHQFQGSKYAYSDVGTSYKELQVFLKKGRKVLFIGTGCQVAGLRSFLKKDYDHLITVDILCHGVPSQKALRDRIHTIERENDQKHVVDIRFRDKEIDQTHTNVRYTFGDGSFYSIPTVHDPFYLGFDSNHLLRENCFGCKYAQPCRISDITLADYWGYYPIRLKMLSYREGVSLMLANTERGKAILNSITSLQKEVRLYKQAQKGNPSLKKPQNKPVGYQLFWSQYNQGRSLESLSNVLFPKKTIQPITRNNWKTYMGIILGENTFIWLRNMNPRKLIRSVLQPVVSIVRFFQNLPHRISMLANVLRLKPGIKRVFYFGITEHPNLGDMAQHYCINNWIGENYPDYGLVKIKATDVTDPIYTKRFFKNLKKVFSIENDIIVFQSGYCTQDLGGKHPLMHQLVCDYLPEAHILMMPQTIYFQHEKNKRICAENHNKAKNMLFLARDFVSFEMAKEMFPNIKVKAYPDIVTTLIGTLKFNNPRNGVCLCTRNDGEKLYSTREINTLARMIEASGIPVKQKDTQSHAQAEEIRNNLQYYIETEIASYSHYKVTITDRYHGTIFSLCAGTPVIIIKTNDHKVTTGADWFKDVYNDYVYVAENLDDAYQLVKSIIEKKLSNQLEPYFKMAYYDKLKLIFESGDD